MKKRTSIIIYAVTAVTFIFAGCKDDTIAPPAAYDYNTIINDFAEKVAIATYHDLDEKAEALHTGCETFKDNPTQVNLDAAANQWKDARIAWESSEAFLFGPASTLSLDPSMDTWPLDETSLQNILNGSDPITPAYVRSLGDELRGFHTVEYLLFRDGQTRTAASVTPREMDYLISAAAVLAEDAATLHEEWEGSFGTDFKNAGMEGSAYTSKEQAIGEIIDGIAGIADEVGNGKIGDPYSTKDVQSVESQFSWNSEDDFQNNIRGIRNAYTGGYNTDGTGLDEFVKSKDEALNTRIMAEINDAIAKIGAMPDPFRNNLNADVQIQAAIAACNKILTTFSVDVKGLLNQ